MRQQLWDKTSIVFAVGIFLTFVAFDVIWCMDTTFASFSFFETYATKIIATLALAGVYALTRADGRRLWSWLCSTCCWLPT